MANQYEPLVTPAGWTGDEKRFAVRLTQILDELYERVGGVRKTAGTKLNASSVANSLDVEDEGYVLDARMGKELADLIDSVASKTYPVGSIYLSVNETDPTDIFGGKWERLKDVFLLASGDVFAAGATGGEADVALTVEQLPEHEHSALYYYDGTNISRNSGEGGYKLSLESGTGSSQFVDMKTGLEGSNAAHNNMPPYLAVYAWKRVE